MWRSSGSQHFPLLLSLFSELTSPQVTLLWDHIISLFRDVFPEGSVPQSTLRLQGGSRAEL